MRTGSSGTKEHVGKSEHGCTSKASSAGQHWCYSFSTPYMVIGGGRSKDLQMMVQVSPGNPLRLHRWRSQKWWREQQALPPTIGIRHPGRFYADSTERKLAECFGPEWEELTRDRNGWKTGLEKWLEKHDVKWARGRRASIRW